MSPINRRRFLQFTSLGLVLATGSGTYLLYRGFAEAKNKQLDLKTYKIAIDADNLLIIQTKSGEIQFKLSQSIKKLKDELDKIVPDVVHSKDYKALTPLEIIDQIYTEQIEDKAHNLFGFTVSETEIDLLKKGVAQ